MSLNRKPRIAFCLEYSVAAFGGTEVLVAELIRGLHQEIDITLVSADANIEGTWTEKCVRHHIHWKAYPEDRAAAVALAKQLTEIQVDLAHFHFGGNYAWWNRRVNASPVIHARDRGLRCLSTNHGFFSPLEGYCAPYRPFWFKLLLFPAAWAAKVQTLRALETEIAVSKYDLRALQRWYPTERRRFRQIYHSKIDPAKDAEPIAMRDRQKVVLCVGTFGARKGQRVLGEAFLQIARKHPEWRLVFAGRIAGSPDWSVIQQQFLAAGLQNQIEHREDLSHEEIEQLLRTSSVFVMPSLFEGLGLSLQEALYYGCACIATQCGGPEDLIDDGRNGMLVPKGDAESLGKALDRMLSDMELRVRLASKARPSVLQRKMTAPDMVDAYRSLYAALI